LELQRELGGDEVYFDSALTAAEQASISPPVPQPQAARARPPAAQPPRLVAEAKAKGFPVARPSSPRPELLAPKATPTPFVVPTGPADTSVRDKDGVPVVGEGLTVVTTPFAGSSAWPDLKTIAEVVSGCTKCPLCTSRTKAVPGEGNEAARLLVVGEGPGEQEDLTGRPFVGRAGELLDKILNAIDTPRETVYIANVVKCRPPRNRVPLPDERAACLPYLHRQIALLKPKVILALGTTAAEALLGVKKPLGDLRLKVHRLDGIPLVVTYHPAALLRNPNWKRPAWDDVRIARQLLDRAG
jgi:DNA polymerase